MSAEENKAVIHRFLEAGNKKDMEMVCESLDQQGTFPILTRFGFDPKFENYRNFLISFNAALPDGHLTIEEMVAEEEKVWVRFTIRGTHQGPLRNVPATNKQIIYGGIGMYCVANGKIVEINNLFDDLSLLRQLGALPS